MLQRISSLVFGLAIVGSAVAAQGQPAKPAPKPAPPPSTQPVKPTNQVAMHTATHKVHESTPGLLKQAKITPEAAEQTAMGAVAGGTVSSRMITKDKTNLVYVFNIKTSGKDGYDRVTVDAMTGALGSNTHHSGSAKKPPASPKKPS